MSGVAAVSFPFPFLTAFLVFVIFLAVRFAYRYRKRDDTYEEFWQKEEAAKHVPKKDLSELSYIEIPIDTFPIGKYDDDEIRGIEDALLSLKDKRIINITGMTNTEVKLMYGTDNLPALSGMEDAYNELTVLLVDYAKSLMEKGDCAAALPVLEFGVDSGTDVSGNYELLGDCYLALGRENDIEALKQKVMERHLILESKILFYLDGRLGKNAITGQEGSL